MVATIMTHCIFGYNGNCNVLLVVGQAQFGHITISHQNISTHCSCTLLGCGGWGYAIRRGKGTNIQPRAYLLIWGNFLSVTICQARHKSNTIRIFLIIFKAFAIRLKDAKYLFLFLFHTDSSICKMLFVKKSFKIFRNKKWRSFWWDQGVLPRSKLEEELRYISFNFW